MASFLPHSSWPLAPTRFDPPSSSFAKPLIVLPRRLESLGPVHSSLGEGETPEATDPVKLAFAKAEAYKNAKSTSPVPKQNPVPDSIPKKNPVPNSAGTDGGGDTGPEMPDSVRLAMERAREYKDSKGAARGGGNVTIEKAKTSGPVKMNSNNSTEESVESNVNKKGETKISSTDFLGLGFSEKKSYKGMPPGLAPFVEPLLDGDLPEVEIIIGDKSNFGNTSSTTMDPQKDDASMDLYKPKVSTWGVFARPSNISKTFGGGKVIRPGEVLETAEDKAAKEKRTRELIAAYKSKMGLTIDPSKKSECEEALKEGDNLIGLGKLKEALPYYEKVMKALVFQSELYGVAALQWSICQDSLRRPNEARTMYEKLQSHPNVQVRKKAKQFMFSFQAMEMMKVSNSSRSRRTGYEHYFEAFVENKDNWASTDDEENEDALRQGLPYIMFLMSPIFIVLFVAVRKSFRF